jgi:hypothetical protein
MNHDLIGIKKLLKIQKNKINQIKFYTRIDNEKYLREHPELEFIIQQFLVKLLEDQPKNCISYAGNFFHTTNFREGYDKYLKNKEKEETEKNKPNVEEKLESVKEEEDEKVKEEEDEKEKEVEEKTDTQQKVEELEN